MLNPGKYTMKFKYVGLEEQSITFTIGADETKVVNITMKEKEAIMDVIVVSASKYAKKLSEETVSIEVMKSSVLQNQNITDVQGGVQKIWGYHC